MKTRRWFKGRRVMMIEILKLIRDAFKAFGVLALAALLILFVCIVDRKYAFSIPKAKPKR